MTLKDFFDDWTSAAKSSYAQRQWLLSKWEVFDGIEWSQDKINVMLGTILDALRPEKEHLFLDLGCGGGWITRLLAGHVHQAVGLDFCAHMLSVAAASSAGSWVQGDIGRLPFKTSSVDRVLSYFVFLNFLDDSFVEKSLLEIHRVLAPGGVALIGQMPDAAGSLSYDRSKKEYMDYCSGQMHLGRRNDQDSRAPLRTFDRESLVRFLRDKGIVCDIRPAFNPFYRQGASVTVEWRFDLLLRKDYSGDK
jgi:SAM-dependent methyltransferase